MAAKQREVRSAKTGNGREIMRPIISSDIMGNRNVEIVPVGAWVEPAYNDYQPDAVMAARLEEEKINRIKDEKENRLQSFRRQVKKRVSHASQVKRQQQIQEAEKAFELERRVIQQSYEMGTSGRKDTCSRRNDDLEHAIKLRLLRKYGEDIEEWDNHRQNNSTNGKKEVKVVDKARQQLVSKKISPQSSKSVEVKSLSGQSGAVNRDIQTPKVMTVVGPNLPPATSNGHQKGGKHFVDDDEADEKFVHSEEDGDDDDDHDGNDDEDVISDNEEYDDDDDEVTTDGKKKPTVQFSDVKHLQKRSKRRKMAQSQQPSSARLAAMLSQFTEGDALARQKRQQAAISRRIFMDREREAVRENLRRQEHRKRIVSLKKEKEMNRKELESLAQQEVDVTDHVEDEEELRQRLEAVHFQEMVYRRRQEIQRSREMDRYLEALRHQLVEKARRVGIQLPALCACGDIWDTHPETCANNCFFYKNNRAYARALQSLLASTEVM